MTPRDCSAACILPASRRASPISFRAASASASPSRVRSPATRRFSCWMSRSPPSIVMTREPLKEEIAALHRGLDIPMLLVTHDLEEALSLADRICVLHAGTTLQIGTPDEVRLRPKSALVARLMGHTNLFEVAVLPGNRIRWGNGELNVAAMNGCSPGPRVTALIPPDAIAIAATDASGAQRRQWHRHGAEAARRDVGADGRRRWSASAPARRRARGIVPQHAHRRCAQRASRPRRHPPHARKLSTLMAR